MIIRIDNEDYILKIENSDGTITYEAYDDSGIGGKISESLFNETEKFIISEREKYSDNIFRTKYKIGTDKIEKNQKFIQLKNMNKIKENYRNLENVLEIKILGTNFTLELCGLTKEGSYSQCAIFEKSILKENLTPVIFNYSGLSQKKIISVINNYIR